MEYQRVNRELEHMLGLYEVWLFIQSKQAVTNAGKELESGQERIKNMEMGIENNNQLIQQLDHEMKELANNSESVSYVWFSQQHYSILDY